MSKLVKSKPSVPHTLLLAFIRKKRAEYVPPQRKGTRKGDPIGFGKTKYEATLYCLHDIDSRSFTLKHLSKVIHVSYDLLRRWHTEKAFLEQVNEHENEFVGVLMEFVKEWHKKGWRQFQAHLKQPIKVIAQTGEQYDSLGHTKELHDMLIDASIYSSSLSTKITRAIFAEYIKALENEDKDVAWLISLRTTIGLLQKSKSNIEVVKKLNRELHRTMTCLSLEMVERVLCMPSPPLEMRKRIVFELSDLRRSIKDGLL